MNALLARTADPKFLSAQPFHCLDRRADFSKNLGELIEEARFDLVDPHITLPDYFRSFRKPSKDLLAVTLDGAADYDQVIEVLDLKALRPAELPELLALAICYPQEQTRGGQILALGSVAHGYHDFETGKQVLEGRFVAGLSWTKELGRVLVPCASGKGRKWPVSCRFLAVSLQS